MPKTILISAPYMLPNMQRFGPVFDHYDLELITPNVEERLEEAELIKFAGQFDGAICGDDRFTEKVIAACLPRLMVISKWGTGIDSIDQSAAARLGVKICNTPEAFTQPVADSVMGYILAFARRQPWMDREMKAGEWQKISGRSLKETMLGVIGVGSIGTAVLERAKAFGMDLLGNDIREISPEVISQTGVQMTSLDDLLARADFVSLNCDLNPSSNHIINPETLSAMKSSAILINTARGSLIDESALINALQSQMIAGSALDVFEFEPLPKKSPLRNMDNVMLAPHNSNSSPSAWEHVHWNSIRNLLEGLDIPTDDLDPKDYP